MIISASRRTDIPAWYFDWFLNRLKERTVLVRNPMNPRQVSQIDLSPDVVDCIVFWSKNPEPMLARLSALDAYAYYIQFTLTGYGTDIEPRLPPVSRRIAAYQELARRMGNGRIIWRYDPILLSESYSISWHVRQYEWLARELAPCTGQSVISFLDVYPAISGALRRLNVRAPGLEEQLTLARELAFIAHAHGLEIASCAEEADLSAFGISHGRCIDDRLISRLLGCRLSVSRDPGQRSACGCVSSIDIGAYHTCPHGCVYCYANHSAGILCRSQAACDSTSPFLCSQPDPKDRISVRKMQSLKDFQLSLFP